MSLCMLFLAALTLAEAEVIETASPDTLVQAKTPDTPSGDGVTTELIEGPKDCEAHQRAVKSKLVTVHYVGSIYRGEMIPKRKFASSKDVGSPLTFQMGSQPRTVIEGFEIALANACEGQTLETIIPPSLGYGDEGDKDAGVPKKAKLHFRLVVVSIADPDEVQPEHVEQKPVFQEIDEDHGDTDGALSFDEVRRWFDAQQEAIKAERAKGSKQPLQDWETLQKIFESDDTNGDGIIAWEEFSGPKQSVAPTKSAKKQEL